MLLDYCTQNGFDVYDIYNDEDFSGSDRDRPDFNRMIEDARDRKFSLILCKTQSRFARDMELVEKYINGLFPIWGIRFIGIVDNADSENKANRKSRQISSLVDQWYLEDLSDNIKATLASKRKQGLWVGAFTPFGYMKDPNDKNHLVIDEEAAEIVRYIFDLYLQGYGLTTIARRLNVEHIPNPATYKQQHNQPFQNSHGICSDLWHHYSIQRMLSNEVYLGNTVQGMQENVSYKSNKKRNKPREEWDVVEGTHDPIIDQDTWDRVQRLRKSKPKSSHSGEPNVLATKVRCLRCGNAMRIYYTRHRRYFRCNTSFFAPDRCDGTTVSEAVLHREIIKQIRNLYDIYVDEESAVRQIIIVNGYQDKITTLKKQIKIAEQSLARLNSRLKAIYIDKIDGVITENEFITLKNQFNEERQALETSLKNYQLEIEEISEIMQDSQSEIDIIKKYKDIQKLDFVTVQILIDYIEVGGNRNNRMINIHWNL